MKTLLNRVSKRYIPSNLGQVFWDRHGHLSWLCQIICLKLLYWPVIFSTKNCTNPKSRLKFSVPSPTVVSVVSLTHQKNLSCVSFLWEKTCVKFIFIPYSSYPVASWPVCKLFLWYPDPSAIFSFGILTRLQTHLLASWPVCKLILWHENNERRAWKQLFLV